MHMIKNKLKISLALGVFIAIIYSLIITQITNAVTVQSPPSGSTIEQRIAQRKKEQGIILEKQAETRLIQQCRSAQTNILNNVLRNSEEPIQKRIDLYQKIDGKLLITIGQLKQLGKDTYAFEQKRTELLAKMAEFKATGINYKQSLDDVTAINCQSDPVGFKALLETSRYYNNQLYAQSGGINNYYVTNIKPIYSNFSKELTPEVNTTK